MLPKFVINAVPKTVHAPIHPTCFKEDPKLWMTKCGWRWVARDVHCRPVYEEDDWPEEIKRCRKCCKRLKEKAFWMAKVSGMKRADR